MKSQLRIPLFLCTWLVAACLALAAVFVGGYFYVEPSLPKAEELRDVRLQVPLRIYSRDGRLIEQFGEQKRTPVAFRDIPPILINAFLAAEDDRFFEHSGIDLPAIGKAVVDYIGYMVAGGERPRGGSTITQQVARDFFLTRDFSLVRKFREWILAFRIEREFSKQEILEIFLNKTFLGQNSYGLAAAAQTYFDKTLDQLTLSEAAILAGIPQGPSIMNPYYSPENAAMRRAYVLRRLRVLGEITDAEVRAALAEPIESHRYGPQRQLDAPYVAEMVRAEMLRRFGPAAQTAGLKVTTTIDSRLQKTANEAVRATLIDYDERHGYRGPLGHVDLLEQEALDETGVPNEVRLGELLADYPDVVDLKTGIVIAADEASAEVYLNGAGLRSIGLDSVSWAARYVNEDVKGPRPKLVTDVLGVGDIVRFRVSAEGGLHLAQLPDVESAFVALDPQDGAIVSLVGGFDYFLNKYNRATQIARQPGSAFKPFVYSAALENGYTAASIINDAPLTLPSAELEAVWRPENFGKFHGEVRLREALTESMNLAAIRTLFEVGIGNTLRHVRKFGFSPAALPQDPSLALGSGGVSPLELARGYAVFANGGHRVDTYFIDRIEDANGELLYPLAPGGPLVACEPETLPGVPDAPGEEEKSLCVGEPEPDAADEDAEPELVADVTDLYPPIRRAPRVITPQNAYLMTDLMKDVIRRGSGRRARILSRTDLAGKTGTTNGPRDAWFSGFNGDIVATAWVGFNQDRPLGRTEQGGVTAIPIWITFMAEALAGRPEHEMRRPPGIVEVKINPETGLVASDSNPRGVFEKFRVGHLPARESDAQYTQSELEGAPGQPRSNEPIF